MHKVLDKNLENVVGGNLELILHCLKRVGKHSLRGKFRIASHYLHVSDEQLRIEIFAKRADVNLTTDGIMFLWLANFSEVISSNTTTIDEKRAAMMHFIETQENISGIIMRKNV